MKLKRDLLEAYERVIADLEAEREARRKVLLDEAEARLEVEFDEIGKLKARSERMLDGAALAPSPESKSMAVIGRPHVKRLTIPADTKVKENSLGGAPLVLPSKLKATSKLILEILGESEDNILTKATALEELTRRGDHVKKGSVQKAYEELKRLGLVKVLSQPSEKGESRFVRATPSPGV